MKKLIFIFILVNIISPSFAQNNEDLKLWYNQPAGSWNEALPLGNGRLAAMIFGLPSVEHIQLNEETIWAGSPNNNSNPEALKALPEVRRLIFEGKYFEAQTLATEKMMSRTNHGMPYQTMGDLYISFPGHNQYTSFYRDLDINNAIAHVTYNVNGTKFSREIFTSFTDQVIIIKLTSDKPGKITCNIFLTSPHENHERSSDNESIFLTGVTENHEGLKGKVRFQTRVKTLITDGTCLVKDGIISVENSSEAVIYISIATNFKNYKELTVDEKTKCDSILSKAILNKYDIARSNHINYYHNFFNRVNLDLGHTDSVKNPTDVRIKQYSNGFDPQLAAIYFQFGRYLLICSSQPGCQPATLQGKWNDKLFPPWDSKYTLNINAEMNYWPAEVANLQEMQEPFIQMIRELSESGRQTAKINYNANGWVVHHNTDIWRITGPVDKATSGMWPSGGAWLCQHLWEKYLYSGDVNYLSGAYPVMKGAARFFLDYMIEEPTKKFLVVCPSNSPENPHAGSEPKASIAAGCTMDNQLLFSLFSNIINASEILGIDKAFADTLNIVKHKLLPMQIGQHGQLQEWMYDWDDPNDSHRHVSHLFGLFPGNLISPFRTPALFNAAKTSLLNRGDVSTGWSMAWKICLWARLLDGNHAYNLLSNQLSLVLPTKKSGGSYANLLDAHPPFQIDGNFGCTAGIAEMLMQSHDGFIYILPALPEAWKNGNVTGLVARGGFEISIWWKNGKIEKLTVYSGIGGNCRLRVRDALKPAKGIELKNAEGENSNPLFVIPSVKDAQGFEKPKGPDSEIIKTIIYDLNTEKGRTYVLYGI